MKNIFKHFGIAATIAVVTLATLSLTACDDAPSGGDENQTPIADDYTISGLSHIFNGSEKAVSISPKSGKSTGARTIYYAGTGDTSYAKKTAAPSEVGTYAITFDVAAVKGWNAASGLSAGTLTITVTDPNTCTIVFDTIGGTPVNPQTVDKGDYVYVGVTTWLGYTFENWYIDEEYTALFDFSVPVNSSRTIYAKWNPITYTVRYDKNANDASGTTADSSHTYDVAKNLSANGYTHAASDFISWNTEADGTGTAYADSQNVGNLSATAGGVIVLYAQWNFWDYEMEWVPSGSFTMGSPITEPGRSSDETEHTVTLTGFYMGIYQVTWTQYQKVMDPSYFIGNPADGETLENYPVSGVSWYDAIVFCNKLSVAKGYSPVYRISGSTNPADWGKVPTADNAKWDAVEIVSGSNGYRLPTEAQWEYAAKDGNSSPGNYYIYSGSDYAVNVAWYSDNSNGRIHGVGLTWMPNYLGLYDMSGNVYEWCWDWYGDYSSEAQEDPDGPVGPSDSHYRYRVARGGSYADLEENVRSAHRFHRSPSERNPIVGFRLVRP